MFELKMKISILQVALERRLLEEEEAREEVASRLEEKTKELEEARFVWQYNLVELVSAVLVPISGLSWFRFLKYFYSTNRGNIHDSGSRSTMIPFSVQFPAISLEFKPILQYKMNCNETFFDSQFLICQRRSRKNPNSWFLILRNWHSSSTCITY